MTAEALVKVEGVKKKYETYLRKGLKREKRVVEALKGISFKVYSGEVFGLLGPNGAGKTTTVKVISTLLIPDEGRAEVMGYDTVKEAVKVRQNIGVSLSVERGFFWKLTGRENLTYFGMLYGLDGERLRERVNELLELVGLSEMDAADKLYEEYSLGMKARLSLARALITDPPVIILDEPTLGLDPPSARRLREILVDLAHNQGKAVIVTTHNMFEAEIMCDRVAIINEGRIVALDTVPGLKSRVADSITLEILARVPANVSVEELVNELNGYEAITAKPEGEGVSIKIMIRPQEKEAVTAEALKALHSRGVDVRRVEVKEPTLEEVFVKLTGRRGF